MACNPVDYESSLKDIEQYWLAHGYPPTVRWMKKKWQVGSTSTVVYRIRRMAELGLVHHHDGMVVPRKMLERVQRALR